MLLPRTDVQLHKPYEPSLSAVTMTVNSPVRSEAALSAMGKRLVPDLQYPGFQLYGKAPGRETGNADF